MKIIILDDHEIFAQSMKFLLEDQEEVDLCDYSLDSESFLSNISRKFYDIILLDISLKEEFTGLDLISKILKINKDYKIIILSSYDLKNYRSRALETGAKAFINKSISIDRLLESIKRVEKGYNEDPQEDFFDKLSPRESEVLRELVKGARKKDIAKKLFISERTLYNHIAKIYDKLRVSNLVEAYNKAIKLGYIDPLI